MVRVLLRSASTGYSKGNRSVVEGLNGGVNGGSPVPNNTPTNAVLIANKFSDLLMAQTRNLIETFVGKEEALGKFIGGEEEKMRRRSGVRFFVVEGWYFELISQDVYGVTKGVV